MCSLVLALGWCWLQAAVRRVRVQSKEVHHQHLGKRNTSPALTENEIWEIRYFMVGSFMEEVRLQKWFK